MENEVRQYELICILEPHLEGADLDNFKQLFEKIVSDNKGQIIHFNEPEKRDLIYPINKQKQGIYLTSHISLEPENVANISKGLKANKNVLRNLITILETPSESKTEKPKAKKPLKTRKTPSYVKTSESKPVDKDDKIKLEEIDKKLDELVGL